MDVKDSDKGILKGCLIDRVDESSVESGDYVIVFSYKMHPMTLHKKLSKAELEELEILRVNEVPADLEWHKEGAGKVWTLDRVIQSDKPEYLAPKNLDDAPAVQDVREVLGQHPGLMGDFNRQASFAKEITKVIDKCQLYTTIGTKKYVHVEGWEALGAMTGHTALIKSVFESPEYFEATAELFDGGHKLVSSGIARAYKEESFKAGGKRRWEHDYQVMSMAQTRAIGKAYRNKLAWIIRLAGYEACPSEEMID
jgi:hypothetical protein